MPDTRKLSSFLGRDWAWSKTARVWVWAASQCCGLRQFSSDFLSFPCFAIWVRWRYICFLQSDLSQCPGIQLNWTPVFWNSVCWQKYIWHHQGTQNYIQTVSWSRKLKMTVLLRRTSVAEKFYAVTAVLHTGPCQCLVSNGSHKDETEVLQTGEISCLPPFPQVVSLIPTHSGRCGFTQGFLLVSPRYPQCRKFPNAYIKLKI